MSSKVSRKVQKEIKKNITPMVVVFFIIFLIVGAVIGFAGYKVTSYESTINFSLIGDEVVYLSVGEEYKEQSCIAKSNNEDIDVTIKNNIDMSKAGVYSVTYNISDNSFLNISLYNITLTRTVVVGE